MINSTTLLPQVKRKEMNSTRRLSQSVFNDLQLADVSIDPTGSGSDTTKKYDKAYLRHQPEENQDGSAENCKEILVLASYMIRTWQTRHVPAAYLGDPLECTSDKKRSSAADSALPPPVKYNRGVGKYKPAPRKDAEVSPFAKSA